jgi:hypothetical protein
MLPGRAVGGRVARACDTTLSAPSRAWSRSFPLGSRSRCAYMTHSRHRFVSSRPSRERSCFGECLAEVSHRVRSVLSEWIAETPLERAIRCAPAEHQAAVAGERDKRAQSGFAIRRPDHVEILMRDRLQAPAPLANRDVPSGLPIRQSPARRAAPTGPRSFHSQGSRDPGAAPSAERPGARQVEPGDERDQGARMSPRRRRRSRAEQARSLHSPKNARTRDQRSARADTTRSERLGAPVRNYTPT